MKTLNYIAIVLCLIFLPALLISQNDNNNDNNNSNDCTLSFYCTEDNTVSVTIHQDDVNQSETSISGSFAVDGDMNTFSGTSNDENSFWEASIGSNRSLSSIDICFGPQTYNGFWNDDGSSKVPSEFYIISSMFPFQSYSLAETLYDPCVEYVHVQNYTNCSTIPLNFVYSKNIRIQHAETGFIRIRDVNVWACPPEICNNGMDDDGDGLVDCEDDNCKINIFNVHVTPSSLQCDDGAITIQAFSSQNLTMSVNNGPAEPCIGSICALKDLAPGDYTIVIDNGVCPETLTVTVEGDAPDTSVSGCNNGSFEEGSFHNWDLEAGNHSGSWQNKNNMDCHSSFDIKTSGQYNDPYLPNGKPVVAPSGSKFFAKLGEIHGGEDRYRMTNCFVVDEDNADFCFSFALILDNPGHGHGEDPSFVWKIYESSSNNTITQEEVSSSDGDFFDVVGSISRRGFTCQYVDLHDYIGTEVCIEFTINECTRGGHGGYALIDGICQDCSENNPDCDFIIPPFVCENQPLDLDFSSTNNFEEYSIQICDGNVCTPENFVFGFSIQDVSIEEIATANNFVLECDHNYTILLKLQNECGSCEMQKPFIYKCIDDLIVDYPECIQACGNTHHLQIPGNIVCNNCIIEWSPKENFIDPGSINPTLNTDNWAHSKLFNEFYSVMVTSEEGCIIKQENIYVGDVQLELMNVSIDTLPQCDEGNTVYTIEGDVELVGLSSWKENQYFDFHDIVIKAYDQINGVFITEIDIEIKENENKLNFNVHVNRDLMTQIKIIVEYNSSCFVVNPIHCGDELLLPEVASVDYNGKWRVFMPNTFTPNGDGINDTYFVFIAREDKDTSDPCDYTGIETSILWYKMSIFDRWGELVFEEEVSDSSGSGIKGNEIIWDGTFNGQDAPIDVYVGKFEFINCDEGVYSNCSSSCNPNLTFCAPTGGYVMTTKDITLVR